jgi:hypothetical protein
MHTISELQLDKLLLTPFKSAQEAQIELSMASLKYISDYGLDSSGNMKIVQINSTYYDASSATTKDVSLNIPFISLINLPSLNMKNIGVDFDITIESQTIITQDITQSNIQTYGYITSGNLEIKKPKYKVHIDSINEKPLGLLMLYDFINTNRDIIRPATGSANVTLKSIFG